MGFIWPVARRSHVCPISVHCYYVFAAVHLLARSARVERANFRLLLLLLLRFARLLVHQWCDHVPMIGLCYIDAMTVLSFWSAFYFTMLCSNAANGRYGFVSTIVAPCTHDNVKLLLAACSLSPSLMTMYWVTTHRHLGCLQREWQAALQQTETTKVTRANGIDNTVHLRLTITGSGY